MTVSQLLTRVKDRVLPAKTIRRPVTLNNAKAARGMAQACLLPYKGCMMTTDGWQSLEDDIASYLKTAFEESAPIVEAQVTRRFKRLIKSMVLACGGRIEIHDADKVLAADHDLQLACDRPSGSTVTTLTVRPAAEVRMFQFPQPEAI